MAVQFFGDWRDREVWVDPPKVRVIEVTVRETDGARLYRLLVEREEIHTDDGARLMLRYIDLDHQDENMSNLPFSAEYSRLSGGRESLSLTRGAVMLNLAYLRGHHVGTYLQDEIVRWAKQWPGAIVTPITLSGDDALDESNKLRRNRFYEQFGIVFEYDNGDKSSGLSMPMLAVDLKPVSPEVWRQNIQEFGLVDYLRQQFDAVAHKSKSEVIKAAPLRDLAHKVISFWGWPRSKRD